ncbi:hypothetical protein BS47DRAFT_1390368 [Hydnum rufescens UP504]|uniref:RRM domain-containing protein n=1 Tax=Hydnum rufescens UP504 TaxID=1448309 RepID=A0A9P6B332_9AGAM|nr:hypothetical protein BS47DRAFT_1390368 [Hydnum rufescens UP504]
MSDPNHCSWLDDDHDHDPDDPDLDTLRLADLEPWMDDAYARQLCDLMAWSVHSIYIPPVQPQSIPHSDLPLIPNNPGYLFLTFYNSSATTAVLSQLQAANSAQAQAGLSPVLMPNSTRPLNLTLAGPADTIAAHTHTQAQNITSASPSPASRAPAGTSQPPPSLLSPPAHTLGSAPPTLAAPPRAQEYSIFVGDLAPEVTNADLVEVFKDPTKGLRPDREPRNIRPFLSCKSAKIMLDTVTGISRGYGFVRFTEESDQRRALIEMQGLYCLSRPSRLFYYSISLLYNSKLFSVRISNATAKARGPTAPPIRTNNLQPSQSPDTSSAQPLSMSSVPFGVIDRAPSRLSSGASDSAVQFFQARSVSSPIAAQSAPTAPGPSASQSLLGTFLQHSAVARQQQSSALSSHPSQHVSDHSTPHRPASSLSYSSSIDPPRLHPMTINDVPPNLIAEIATLAKTGQLDNIVAAYSSSTGPVQADKLDLTSQRTTTSQIPMSYSTIRTSDGQLQTPSGALLTHAGGGSGPSSSGRSSNAPSPAPNITGVGVFPSQHNSQQQSAKATEFDAFAADSTAGSVGNSTDQYNTTVFVGGLSGLVPEDTLRSFFSPFGDIHYVKIPPGKGCGFVQFVRKADAARAIEKMHGYSIGGSKIRLSWGRSQFNAAQAARATMADSLNQVQLSENPAIQSVEPKQQGQPTSTSATISSASFQAPNAIQGMRRYPQQPQQPRSRMFGVGFSPFSPEINASGFLPPSSLISTVPAPPSLPQQAARTYENVVPGYDRTASSPSYRGASGHLPQQSQSRPSLIPEQTRSHPTFPQQPDSYSYPNSDGPLQQRQIFSNPAPGSSDLYNVGHGGSRYPYGSSALYLDERTDDVQRFHSNSYADLGRSMANLTLDSPPNGASFSSGFTSSPPITEYGFPPIASYNLDSRQEHAQ